MVAAYRQTHSPSWVAWSEGRQSSGIESVFIKFAWTGDRQVTMHITAVTCLWRVRGKIIRSVLCNIVCNNCAQCNAHTYEQTNRSLDWVLSHWAHFNVLRFIFVYVCKCMYFLCDCILYECLVIVTW